MCGQLIYNKEARNIQWGKDRENYTAKCRGMKLDHSIMPYTKIKLNSKMD